MKINLQVITIFVFLFTASMGFAREYIIFSIVQSVPMGNPNETIKKNYYLNMGQKQGIQPGTVLDVYRSISRSDPYETKKRYQYKVKIGELKVLHSEDESSIGSLVKVMNDKDQPLFEIENFMIGDNVSVKVGN